MNIGNISTILSASASSSISGESVFYLGIVIISLGLSGLLLAINILLMILDPIEGAIVVKTRVNDEMRKWRKDD